jgi:outer membrane murein-binding lipoprotein Lpp
MKIVAPILISALVAWGAVNIRVAVLETRVDELRSNITEIRADVKSLLRMQGEAR